MRRTIHAFALRPPIYLMAPGPFTKRYFTQCMNYMRGTLHGQLVAWICIEPNGMVAA